MSTVRLNLVRLEQRLRSKVDDDFWGILRNLVVSQSFPPLPRPPNYCNLRSSGRMRELLLPPQVAPLSSSLPSFLEQPIQSPMNRSNVTLCPFPRQCTYT